MGKIGDKAAIPALIKALGDNPYYVRRKAAKALGTIGDPIAIPSLTKALKDDSPGVRQGAAEALGKIKGASE